MLPNNQYPISQRKSLIRIARYRCIHRSMPDRDARRRRDHQAHMLIRCVPHLDPEGEVCLFEVCARDGLSYKGPYRFQASCYGNRAEGNYTPTLGSGG